MLSFIYSYQATVLFLIQSVMFVNLHPTNLLSKWCMPESLPKCKVIPAFKKQGNETIKQLKVEGGSPVCHKSDNYQPNFCSILVRNIFNQQSSFNLYASCRRLEEVWLSIMNITERHKSSFKHFFSVQSTVKPVLNS